MTAVHLLFLTADNLAAALMDLEQPRGLVFVKHVHSFVGMDRERTCVCTIMTGGHLQLNFIQCFEA
jgi:hypothetical protein